MRDTTPETEARYRALLLERSGEERLQMAGSMYATARALVVASIVETMPGASPATIRRAVFLRFYGHEFDAGERERIAARLGREATPADAGADRPRRGPASRDRGLIHPG